MSKEAPAESTFHWHPVQSREIVLMTEQGRLEWLKAGSLISRTRHYARRLLKRLQARAETEREKSRARAAAELEQTKAKVILELQRAQVFQLTKLADQMAEISAETWQETFDAQPPLQLLASAARRAILRRAEPVTVTVAEARSEVLRPLLEKQAAAVNIDPNLNSETIRLTTSWGEATITLATLRHLIADLDKGREK